MSTLPRPGEFCTPTQAQQLAVREAQRGAGLVAPNPLVGCSVVSKDGRLLATGFHARVGEAHAEVDALDKLKGEDLSQATMYVTLEPCSHQGRTPPCADRLIKDRIGKVVIGTLDPNPLVAGKGAEKLRAAGIDVSFDAEFAAESSRVAEVFLWNMQKKLPYVTLKLAMSLDGKIALPSGESHWLTSDHSRRLGRELRAHADATVIGAQTLLHDNPQLDFRDTKFAGQKANRIFIWDPQEKTKNFLPASRLAKTHSLENIHVLKTLDVEVLQSLYAQGITSLYVEGGAKTLSAFIEKKLFNKLYVFVAPLILGQGLDWASSLRLNSMAERLELEFTQNTISDRDVLLTAYPRPTPLS